MNFEKITEISGFDKVDPDNARQNNYAWSMTGFGDYVYVGTGRNVPYNGYGNFGLIAPEAYTPENPTMAAEIWRYPKYGSKHREWERVFRAPIEWNMMGFRSMEVFTDNKGETALYCGCYARGNGPSYMLKSTDGRNWKHLPAGIEPGYSTRSVKAHKGKLYTSALHQYTTELESFLYVTENPEKGWTRVNTSAITGEIFNMISFNGSLYLATMPVGGFELWRCEDPESGKWKCIVDKGAGDALNECPLSLEVFDNHLYIGVGISCSLYSTDPVNRWIVSKGFDLVRVSTADRWEIIIGQEPIAPTQPTTGTRNLGQYPSGLGNMANGYCWELRSFGGRLYLGTWDTGTVYKTFLSDLILHPSAEKYSKLVTFLRGFFKSINNNIVEDDYHMTRWFKAWFRTFLEYPKSLGFDFASSKDGKTFEMISIDGFGNKENMGIRRMYTPDDQTLYIGTASASQGCEVWTMKKQL
ncbi:hypothetical protein I2494_06505 [Budviciaceae bacterium BWR-B9]|uniref:Uncharacterized protein n=1 Tax=Limnobaculum allomyrinae TaxID=2791986 RepID=A0ABS1IPA8_9GAMM|nr:MULTISPECIES: hypothetical protein [Limnobaculum]MBK5143371.1 hypothetical protein [Limnobaculum allomyrinae]MBV7691259.1 hypothetical protein [Limnobaculum sp. M2-1]